MDIIKQKKTPFYKNKIVLASVASALFASVVYATTQVKLAGFSMKENSVISAIVERGSFDIKVSGPGILVPRDIRWVSSTVAGKVERILGDDKVDLVIADNVTVQVVQSTIQALLNKPQTKK